MLLTETQNTEIFLIRHGQPALQNALLGATDSPLSKLGWSQLESAVENLENMDLVISSPLSRCATFSQQYADDNNLELLINNHWQECFFGDWDGKTYQSLYQEFPKAIDGFFSEPNKNTPPNGESLSNFNNRIENALMSLLKKYQGKRVAVFTHAGVIRTLVAWCLKMDYSTGLQFKNFAVDYASMTQLSIFHNQANTDEAIFPQLKCLNVVK